MRKVNSANYNTKEYWNDFYTKSGDDIDIERFNALSQVVKKGDKILDVGGGSGELLEFIGGKAERTLFDISREGLKKAKQLKRAEHTKVGSIYRLPYSDNSFDVVLCAETLEHLERPKEAIEELIRVSKRHVSISVPYLDSIKDPCHIWEFEPSDLVEMLGNFGKLKLYQTSGGMIMVANLEKEQCIIADADDFAETNSGLNKLMFIKSRNPEFKITLFTIPGLCSKEFLKKIQKLDWIDLVPHGWVHPNPLECLNWSYQESKEYLKKISKLGMTKGFKAPGWQISDGMYQALLEEGYWVADQSYNNDRRPKDLKAYLLDSPNKLHFHINHLGGFNENEIGYSMMKLANLKGKFGFIKDYV